MRKIGTRRAFGGKVLVCLSVAALLLGAGCGDDDDDDSSAAEDETTTTVASDDAASVTPLSVQAADFEFEPDSLSATSGASVTITVENTGEATHTFTSNELQVDEEVQPGDTAEVSASMPDEAGTVDFECRFHGGSGMTGTIEVS